MLGGARMPLAFATIDWLVLAGYLLGVLALGAWFARRQGGGGDEDYFLANRSMPLAAVTLSLVATSLSAATFVGAPSDAYAGNLTFLVLYLGNFAAVFVVAFVFVPRLYAAGGTTIYAHLGRRYGPAAQRAAGVTFVLGRLLASGARLFLAATPLWLLVFGRERDLGDARWELALCVVIVGVVGTLYTLLGGIRAVMWTDVVQIALVVLAVAVTALVAYNAVGLPFGDLFAKANDAEKLTTFDWSLDLSKPYTPWTALVGNLVFFAAVFGTDHDLAQRFLTAKSAKSGMISVVLSQVVGLVVVAGFMVLGLLLWAYYLDHPAAPLAGQPVFVVFMVDELPPVVAGLAVAGLFAAAQSSMDSATNAISASLIHDVIRPDAAADGATYGRRTNPISMALTDLFEAVVPRLLTLGVGGLLTAFGVACCFAFDPAAPGGFLGFALGVMAYAVTGLMGVFLCAFFTRRGNGATVVAALLTGAAVTAAGRFVPGVHWFWFVPIAVAASFAVCAAGHAPARPRGFEVLP